MKPIFELPSLFSLSGHPVTNDDSAQDLGSNWCSDGGGSYNDCYNGSGTNNGCESGSGDIEIL
jgi:hypothetical protein